MKHNARKFNQILKALNKSPEIKNIKFNGKVHFIQAGNGEQYAFHMSEKGLHPLRRWLKVNTSIKDLKV